MVKNNLNIITQNQPLIIAIIIIAFLAYGFTTGLFTGLLSIGITAQAPLNPTTEYPSYEVKIETTPNPLCTGNDLTGTITSNIPNGICSIFFDNGTGYALFANVNLDTTGSFAHTQAVTVSGTADFKAVCCDNQRNCKTSNTVNQIVTTASPPCPAGTDSDGDGFTDDEEMEAGTNPFDPNDYPGYEPPLETYTCGLDPSNCYNKTCPTGYTCNEVWFDLYTHACTCTTEGEGSQGEVHPDWKPGGINYNPVTDPECSSDAECGTNYFCFEGSCEPRCIDRFGIIRTEYKGANYGACWEICDTDTTCCANAYFYYDGATVNGKQAYYWACEWVEGQRCSSFNVCQEPGGFNP